MISNNYFIVDIEKSADGIRGPRLPEDIDGFLLLAEPNPRSDWALYSIHVSDDQLETLKNNSSVQPVSDELDNLLNSARRYPPALAMARELIRQNARVSNDISCLDRKFFESILINQLRAQLDFQRQAPYFLAECRNDELGYRSQGSYYWIIGFSKSGQSVQWISDDYWVYEDSVSAFIIDDLALSALPYHQDISGGKRF